MAAKANKAGLIAFVLTVPGALLVLFLWMVLMPNSFGAKLFGFLPERRRVREALRRESIRYGLDPDWLDAIGMHEGPYWKLSAINMTGGDGARGGAYGPTQITQKTARAYGYDGPMSAFNKDPDLVAKWSVIIMKAGNPKTFADAAAWWNAGKRTFASLSENHVTRTKYYPAVLKALGYVKANPTEREIV